MLMVRLVARGVKLRLTVRPSVCRYELGSGAVFRQSVLLAVKRKGTWTRNLES